uniref:Chorein N-terminal domain-containing protein n=1 Tax=Lepeophtheirus salmonis TaxID=72036 RepID=A0A0K2T0P4_LEPSM
MFKLESYITPIILSYVEKYAKNLKAERSQFSLWGGDAVFSNLDLRLDVLERELNIPFTFVSGHIHELHIHVPWTRLHADPIVITINTIECVLRLPGDEESSETSIKRPVLKKPRITDEKIPPPGYVQSLINKIISNVSIVCNNLILKYVEEDIVLSLNTRSVKLSSCDDNWDPSFIELSLPNLILRKIIDVSDLTICLDKRNASGKIECYQEPLLYRCSLKVHVAWIYDSLNAKIPRISRFEIRCPKLEFSITETQMPMLLRLFHLAMALYFGKLNPTDSHQSAIGSKEYEESENSANLDNVGGDSWSGWAWNVGSTVGTALLPIYWEDEDEEELKMHKGLSKFNRVLHLGFYVDHASVDLKLTEISKEKRFFGTTSHKQSFTPYCKFGFHGIFGAVSVKGINSVNVRGGINAFETLPLGNCPCGVDEKDREDFYIIGGPNYEEHEDKKGSLYLSGSLFDKDRGDESGIPIEKRRNYDIVWDAHMDEVTEEIMLERSSAFALDYLYYWEIPNDWSSEQLSEISTDFEYSNLSERALFRAVFGPFLCYVSTGFLHRIDLMREALIYYDYYPYYDINDKNPFIAEETSKLESSLEEEIDLIQNGSIPVRVYQITAIQPCFVISAINHSHNNKQGKPQLTEFVLPSAKCSMGYIDLTYTTPMYPFRCAKTISLINEPRLGLLHSSIYASANANLLDVSIHLCHGERSVTLLQPSKLKGGFKRLLFSKYWKKDTLPHWEITFEVNSFKFRFTKPQILLLTYILSKGILVHFEKEALSVIVKDSLTKKLCSIVISISGTKLIAARTINVSSLQLVIDEIGINLLPSDSNLGSIPILSREKGNEDFNKTSPGRASINSGSPSLFVLQFPNDHKNQFFNDTPPIVYCNIAEFYINFDPTLYEWIQYSVSHTNKTPGNSLNASLIQIDEQISTTLSSRTDNHKKKKKTPDHNSNFLISIKNWFPSISGAFIQIKAQGVKAFFPSNSLIGVRSVKDAVKKAISSSNVLLKVSFPNITLENTAHIPVIQQFLTGFPIILPTSVWNPMKNNLPLKIKFNDFSISDENKNIYFLDPNHLSCTLDLKSNEDNRLNLCMHIDASNSFKFRIDSDFLLAFTDVMNCFISCLRTMCPLKIEEEECFDENESSYTPEPISSIRSQSGLFDSGKLIDESILSSSNVSSNTVIKESNSEICLTHWFQCTIPSISINFHPMNEEDSILNLEMEDITASLDVQPHYTKLKSRIMSAFMSKSDGEILLSCGENFSPEIKSTDGNTLQILPHSRLFESANFKTQGVFNFTFVRALITNAKWKSFLKKSKTLINNEDEYYDIDDPRYLSEVYIKSSAIDIAFCPETLSKYLNIFSKSLSNLKLGGAPAERKKNTSYPIDLWINNNTLPLFHFKGKSIRIFCRNNNNLIGSDFQDTVLFHIESINMSSNVENALSRLLIRPDLYYLAEQCEVLSVMGSKIEDRQYSANFTGVGIYTGNWNKFVEKSRKNSDIVLKTMEENPALEWNTSELNRQEDNDDEPFFYPILKQFNLQITYAPAIVYYSSNMSKKLKSRLIAGHSLEINAVSNINVYASLDQIRLCRGITEDIQKSFTSLLMQKKDSEASASSDCSHITDSGCESVISLSHTRYKHLKFVPLEVLITGSSISLSLYQLRKGEHDSNRKTKSREVRYKNRKRDIIKEQSLIDDGNQCLELPPLNLSNPSNDESLINEKNQMNNEDSFQLNPLLFVALSQPHVFISITRSSQKLELSFYDISLNSSSNEDFYIITKDKHSLPSEAVFLNHWIETKPGDADPLSGIPPALFTATISDFFISSPKLSISIDRPLKLNIDEQNFSRGSEILKQLYQSLNLKPSPSQYSSKSSSFSIIHLLRLSKIIISTKQILIAHPINHIYAEFFVGLSSLDIQVNSQEYEASQIEVDFNNVSIRTKLRDITHRFLNPWSFSISSDLTWAKWKEEPIVYLNLSSKSIEIDMGPNTVLSILLAVNYYCQHYTSWKGELDNFSSLSSNSESKTFRKSPSPEQHYSDDLRAGAFKYITNVGTKASDIRPYQVVFTPRALTWRYPQPRALTGTTIYPVPLLAASELGRQAFGPDNQVICGLQYWDLSLKSFRTYSEFALSESEVSYLNLPILSDRKRIAVSPIWRVVLNICAEEEQEREDEEESFPSDYVLLEDEVIVTAKSLVSVLKVDSFFSPELIPKFQVSGKVSSLSLRFHNHFHFFSRERIPEFKEYHFYQAFPLDQAIFNIHLNSISFGLDNWNDKSNGSHLLFRLKSQMKVTFLDYKFLGINTFLSPFKFQTQIYSFNNSIADISFHSRPLHFRVGHFLHHSLEVSSWIWKEVLKSSSKDQPPLMGSCSMPIISNYVICNHSQSHLQFGQVGTDEAICIKPQEIYMYSWRSSKAQKYLHIRTEKHANGDSMGVWSEAFPLVLSEKENIVRRTGDPVPNIFIINFKQVQLCLQVTISGLIGSASCLKEPLEIKLVPKKNTSSSDSNSEEDLLQKRILLSPYTAAPSIIMDPDRIEGIKIRILGIGLAWSGTIPTILREGRNHSVLVRVPTKEKEHCLTLWCRVLRESYENDTLTRILYVFSPMYVARSLLPNSMSTYLSGKSLSGPFEVSLPGRDSLVQFDTLGDELQYAISFKVCQELPSSEPIQISWGMIEKIRKVQNNKDKKDESSISIDEMICKIPSIKEPNWLISQSFSSLNEQPKTDVQISFVQVHPLLNTLCIEVRPSVIIINELNVTALFEYEGKTWDIAPQSVFVPPILTSTFSIGLCDDENSSFFCSRLELSNQDWNIRQLMPTISGYIPVEGSVQIKILVREDYICYLTLCSNFDTERNIRSLHIKPTFNLIQKFPEPLTIASLSVGDQAFCSLNNFSFAGYSICQNKDESVPLLYWQIIGSPGQRFLSLSDTNGNKNEWSIPVCLDDFPSELDQRRFIDFPINGYNMKDKLKICNLPLTLTLHKRDEMFYIVLCPEDRPFLMAHNNLHKNFVTVKQIFKYQECMKGKENFPSFNWIEPGHSTYLPLSSGSQSSFKIENEKLSFIFASTENTTTKENIIPSWSEPLDVEPSLTEYSIWIPNHGDSKVIIDTIGYTTHIFFKSLSQEEIHAKDIRARINSSEGTDPAPEDQQCIKQSIPSRNFFKIATNSPLTLYDSQKQILSPQTSSNQLEEFHAYTYFEEISFTLSDDAISSDDLIDEFVKLTLDSVSVTMRPRFEKPSFFLDGGVSKSTEICLTIFQIQLDNQMFKSNRFDFGIIAIGKSDGEEGKDEIVEENGVPYRVRTRVKVPISSRSEYIYEELKKNSLILCHLIFDGNYKSKGMLIKSASLNVQPMFINIEDTFLYKMTEVINSFGKLNNRSSTELDLILASSSNIEKYIRLESIQIDPIRLSVSIRAFVKMYIGVHESPLNFGAFSCSGLNTTSSFAMGNTIARHYISGTLFKAGWVVGSLDILGSPTGFTRTLGDGVRDLFALPYEGSFRGPWAFISGLVHGSSSLVKHITAGTLTSVTNFASSVSRNLDRLSLDCEHQERNEVSRRSSKPSGLGQGILYGLSGVGIGILGAIGGIAHHPLQAMFESGASPTGLIGGVTRGIAGVVTKPLGGAAEFIALTGQGILRGTGWSRDIRLRSGNTTDRVSSIEPGELMYSWKILDHGLDWYHTSIVYLLNASEEDNITSSVTILLTTEAIFLISNDSSKTRIYSLISLELQSDADDPNKFSLLYYKSLNIDEEERHKTDRVTQFVLGLSGQSEPMFVRNKIALNEKFVEISFIASPFAVEYFNSLFILAKRQNNNKGFDSL